MTWNKMKNCLAEFIGTFILVFAGTSAIVVNDLNGGVVTHVGISLVFGLIVLAIIYTIGDISGAHINPAVTIAFWWAGRFPAHQVLPYVISQISGALVASIIVNLQFSGHQTLGATIPIAGQQQAFILETILTFILMLVVINVSTGAKEKGLIAGIAIGSVIATEALFAGPITGASMNPARSIGPAIISGQMQYLWIYLIAPVCGAILAIFSCRFMHEGNCCQPVTSQNR